MSSESIVEQIFTVAETAARLKIGRSKLYELIKKKLLRPSHIDGRAVVKGSEILRFISTL